MEVRCPSFSTIIMSYHLRRKLFPSIASRLRNSSSVPVIHCEIMPVSLPSQPWRHIHHPPSSEILVTAFSIMTHWTQFPQHLPLPGDFTWTQCGRPCFHVKHGIQSSKTSHTEPSSTLGAWGLLLLEKTGGCLRCLCETLFTNKPLEI